MFDQEIGIPKKDKVMIQIISKDYLSSNSSMFKKVVVDPGEALFVSRGNNDKFTFTNTVEFTVDETDGKKKKEGFFAKIFKKKVKSTNIDLTKNDVMFIRADLKPCKYKVEFRCRTSDFCVVRGVAKVDAFINKEDMSSLYAFRGTNGEDEEKKEEEVKPPEIEGEEKKKTGWVEVFTVPDIERIMADETKAKVGGLLLSIHSNDLIGGTYRDTVRKAIDDMKLEWIRMGFTVQNMEVEFNDTTYEQSKMLAKDLEDREIGNEASYDAKMKQIKRLGEIESLEMKNKLAIELMEAEGKRKIITANPESLEEEIAKDNAHRRHIELMHAEAELEKAKKGYLEGYIDGYKDGQDYLLNSNLIVKSVNNHKEEKAEDKKEEEDSA